MTREEAISEISKIIFELGFEDTPSTDKRVDALNMAIEALKQEPKTGYWKRISIDKYVQHAQYYYRCSECGEDVIGEHNYCHNCGARMAESEN